MKRASIFGRARGTTIAVATIACVAITSSCTENLPIGPDTFAAQVQIVAPHDTIVVGDSSSVSANATDGAGHRILSLKFGWTSADSTIVGFAATSADSDAVNGRTRILIGRRPGRAVVSVALPDLRFVVPTETRTTTVVVGGIKVLSSHDTILTAVNDTGVRHRDLARAVERRSGQSCLSGNSLDAPWTAHDGCRNGRHDPLHRQVQRTGHVDRGPRFLSRVGTLRRYGRRARRAAAHAHGVDPHLLGVELRRFARTDGHARRSSRQRARPELRCASCR